MFTSTNNETIWKERLDNTKWILTLLIVLYHIQLPPSVDGFQGVMFLYIKNLGDCVVTSFSLISGFLFFYNARNLSDVYKKMKRRIKTLLVPYIMWNLVNSLYLILKNNGITGFIRGIIAANWLKSIMLWNASPHFWYIFMLIFWTILAPVLYIAFKDKRLLMLLLLSQTIYFLYKGAGILTSRYIYIYILYTWGLLRLLFP